MSCGISIETSSDSRSSCNCGRVASPAVPRRPMSAMSCFAVAGTLRYEIAVAVLMQSTTPSGFSSSIRWTSAEFERAPSKLS